MDNNTIEILSDAAEILTKHACAVKKIYPVFKQDGGTDPHSFIYTEKAQDVYNEAYQGVEALFLNHLTR